MYVQCTYILYNANMHIYVSHRWPTAEPNRLSFFEVTQIKRVPWGKSNFFIPRATPGTSS